MNDRRVDKLINEGLIYDGGGRADISVIITKSVSQLELRQSPIPIVHKMTFYWSKTTT
jgi:hypothetical protein